MVISKPDVNIPEYNITKSKRQVFPSRLVDREKLLVNLNIDLNQTKQKCPKNELWKILHKNNETSLRNYSQKVFNKVYINKEINNSEVQEWMKLFQTAFLEMEWLFGNMPRKESTRKTWFDHLLWVLDNILQWPNPTIEKCIIAILHDSIEDIPWYTANHVKRVYGEKIANSVNNMAKEPLEYYIKRKWLNDIALNKLEGEDRDELTNEITRKTRREHYYGNISNRWKNEIEIKFADRLNSLETMYYYDNKTKKREVDKPYLIKKIKETEKYFLIPKLKSKVSKFHYDKLEQKYLERQSKLNTWEI